MFGAKDYTSFEGLMEGELRDALAAQDECITHAYDDAINGKLEFNDLGSGLIDQSQKATAAAMQIADK